MNGQRVLPQPPTLPRTLLATIGEYGMARTDGLNELEIQDRWIALIDGIKTYAIDYARAAAALGESK